MTFFNFINNVDSIVFQLYFFRFYFCTKEAFSLIKC